VRRMTEKETIEFVISKIGELPISINDSVVSMITYRDSFFAVTANGNVFRIRSEEFA
jgi:hypothetical protein